LSTRFGVRPRRGGADAAYLRGAPLARKYQTRHGASEGCGVEYFLLLCKSVAADRRAGYRHLLIARTFMLIILAYVSVLRDYLDRSSEFGDATEFAASAFFIP
jgi:hypothetical protein